MAKWPAHRGDAKLSREIHSHLYPLPGWQAVVREHKNGKPAIQGAADVSPGLRPSWRQFRLISVAASRIAVETMIQSVPYRRASSETPHSLLVARAGSPN